MVRRSGSEGGFVGGFRGESMMRQTRQARVVLEHPAETGRGRRGIFHGPGAT